MIAAALALVVAIATCVLVVLGAPLVLPPSLTLQSVVRAETHAPETSTPTTADMQPDERTRVGPTPTRTDGSSPTPRSRQGASPTATPTLEASAVPSPSRAEADSGPALANTSILARTGLAPESAIPIYTAVVVPQPSAAAEPPRSAPLDSRPEPRPVESVPTSTPTPSSADLAWERALARLDAVWGRDWPATIALLYDFRRAFPDYAPARDKLYAAHFSYGWALAEQGRIREASAQLDRAEALLPDHTESSALLLGLRVAATAIATASAPTATPTPSPAPDVPKAVRPAGAITPAPAGTSATTRIVATPSKTGALPTPGPLGRV